MSVRPNARVVLAGVVAATLCGTGLVAVWAADATAGCSWTDPSGDASADGGSSDADLDLTRLSFASDEDGNVLLTAKVKTLDESGPQDYAGDEFEFDFTMNDHSFVVGGIRTKGTDDAEGETSTYLLVDGDDHAGDASSLNAEFDPDGNTVQLTVSADDLAALSDGDSEGAVLSELTVVSSGRTDGDSNEQVDDSDAGEASWKIGASKCTGSTGSSDSGDDSSSDDPDSENPDASPSPEPELQDQPTVGCALFTDPADDANPQPVGNNTGTGKEPDVDLRSVVVKTLPDSIVVFVKVTDLLEKPSAVYQGHRFLLNFTYGSQAISYRADAAGVGTGSMAGVVSPDLTSSVTFDTTRDQVVFTLNREGLGKATKSTPADGKKLTGLTAKTQVLMQGYGKSPAAPGASPSPMPTVDQPVDADSAAGTTSAQQSYAVGDNTCFLPPGAKPKTSPKPAAPKAASLTVTVPKNVQYGDFATISVTLKSSSGKALTGKTVTATFGTGDEVSGKTATGGKATLKVKAVDAAGARPLVVGFEGDSSAAKKEVRKSLTVVAEGIKLAGKSSGTGSVHTLTATLTDDDAPVHPLSGQIVTFDVGGKKTNVHTDAAGHAVMRVKAGATVVISFAGKTGYYTAGKIQAKA